ncbi:MAG: ISAzo13 family transposase [Pirellulaceae bacterium]|nr:ISAzo13 family transposase [Pirellulaceae bacterium]MBX3417518.1 ISAzo13 family transposase [Pirellulaceae bacterium]
MQDAKIIETIRNKYIVILADLDERASRRWAAAEAIALGHGGITAVSKATGISDRTIRNGIRELNSTEHLTSDRQRRLGGGRKKREVEQPNLVSALEELLNPVTRGDPQSALRWTCKSTRILARELNRQGFNVSSTKVGQILRSMGYSLQSNRKSIEGKQHPDRNAQFEFIAKRVSANCSRQQPCISVDTKKKEVLGNLKNAGKTYRKSKSPREVETHDFPKKELGKAVPYGVYDIAQNEAGVTVGISSDTAEFAVAAIDRWWTKLGKVRYSKGKRVLITADSGGSNSPRTRLWRVELQKLANKTGLIIEVCHYPPGTSKWNKIEHKLFCHITRNWRGIPLETFEIIVKLISATTTETGLEVHAWLDTTKYQTKKSVSTEELNAVTIVRNKFHGEWNYTIRPQLSSNKR